MRRVSAGFGLANFPFTDVRAYWRWVDMCEADGADSLWLSDRLVGVEPVLECMTGLASLAGRTRRLKFGMNVLSLAIREPVLVAKQCATIDLLSEGRLLPGFGIGSPKAAEWQALGLDPTGRGGRSDEALEIISRLWTGETLDFAGSHFSLSAVSIRPLPVQQELPMWIGGSSPASIRRTARFGTGWQGGVETPEQIAPVISAIAQAAKAYGRPIDPDHYGMTIAFRFGASAEPATVSAIASFKTRVGFDPAITGAFGDGSDILARLQAFVTAGISKFVMLPLGSDDSDLIDQTRRFLAEVAPRVPALWHTAH
jgi:probable F420-dependent oxidoreductase